jgi:hypothetical protein
MAAPPQAKTAPDESLSLPADGALTGIRNQALFRRVNEEISRIAASFAVVDEELELLCECEHGDCVARISITLDDYEAIRNFPTRVVIKPEHLGSDGERLVAESDGYAVVEKLGRSAAAAIMLEPRKQTTREEETR